MAHAQSKLNGPTVLTLQAGEVAEYHIYVYCVVYMYRQFTFPTAPSLP